VATYGLQIRRCPREHPASFRSVRDLGQVAAGSPCRSGPAPGRSFRWLPAWLPASRVNRSWLCVEPDRDARSCGQPDGTSATRAAASDKCSAAVRAQGDHVGVAEVSGSSPVPVPVRGVRLDLIPRGPGGVGSSYGVGSAGTCAVHQQDSLGVPGQDHRQGPLDGRDVVPGAAAGDRCIVVWRRRPGLRGRDTRGGGHLFYTGVDRERDCPTIPSVGSGMDVQALVKVYWDQMQRRMANPGFPLRMPNLDTDEINRLLAAIPTNPDEKLR